MLTIVIGVFEPCRPTISIFWFNSGARLVCFILTAMGICSYFILIMPEPYRPNRGLPPFMLSAAAKNGSLVKASCVGCSPPRWYLPADMIRLFGDIPAINLERKMRCRACGADMDVRVTSPLPEERQKIRLHRLDKVWWVRRASWRLD